jgi:hypothetical protein
LYPIYASSSVRFAIARGSASSVRRIITAPTRLYRIPQLVQVSST